ncbi:uncharacterized protein LOC141685279 [Apium graveolens]|uniref:uncharacterized protein LOC141685279 n=1 Tax=Apium graveolens TaxID=4045 RepID=UPI003D7C13D0
MTLILGYTKEGSLSNEKNEARRIRYKAARYVIYDGVLYKRGFSVPLPKCIDRDGKQFDSKEMRECFEQLGIQKSFSVVCHPQSNGQTKAVNKIIKHTLKAKLEVKKGTWPEELAQVLWSYNMTPRTITGETPFSLVYGCEAMVPIQVGEGSFRRDNYDSEENEVNHRLYLDMIEETQEDA